MLLNREKRGQKRFQKMENGQGGEEHSLIREEQMDTWNVDCRILENTTRRVRRPMHVNRSANDTNSLACNVKYFLYLSMRRKFQV